MRAEDNLQRADADLDPVAGHQRPTAAAFGGAIDPNPPGLNEGLRLAPGLHNLGPLQECPEFNARRDDWNAFSDHRGAGGPRSASAIDANWRQHVHVVTVVCRPDCPG